MVGWFLWAQVSRHLVIIIVIIVVIIIVIVIIVVIIIVIVIVIIVIIILIIITSATAATDVWCRCHAVPDAHPEEARSADDLEAKARRRGRGNKLWSGDGGCAGPDVLQPDVEMVDQ